MIIKILFILTDEKKTENKVSLVMKSLTTHYACYIELLLCSYFITKTISNNYSKHDPNSPLLFGSVGDDDTIKIREVISCRDCQMNLFE